MANILVIEDDKEINALVCDYLSTLGHHVFSAENGMTGLSAIREKKNWISFSSTSCSHTKAAIWF